MTVNRLRYENSLRLIGALVVMLALVGSFAPRTAAQERDAAPLDIAAMVLTSADINDADLVWQGSRDYGLDISMTMPLDDFLRYSLSGMAVVNAVDEEEARERLGDAGFVRAYQGYFLPMTVADGDAKRGIMSYVIEFADEEGAEDAFSFLQDEFGDEAATDLDEFDQVGDASEATLVVSDDTDAGDPAAMLDATVLLDRLHIGVTFLDWSGAEPDVADAEVLIEAMLDRVEDALDASDWGLSTQVVRLTGETVSPHTDAYLLRDGEGTLLEGDDFDEDELAAWSEEQGQIDEYRLWQRLLPPNDDDTDNAWYYLSVFRFVDEETAQAWLEARPELVEEYEAFTEVEFLDADEVDIGDAAFSYTAESASTGNYFRDVTFRLGNLVVTIDLTGPNPVPSEAMAALVEAQWTCLEIRNCFQPMEMPDALQEYLEGIQEESRT